MREIVIVIADLYLTETVGRARRRGAGEVLAPMPGLEHFSRFGESAAVEGSWRSWLARWVGRPDLESAAPASVAAKAADYAPADSSMSAWMASPLHLAAGMTTLHADFRSRLRLSSAEVARLAGDFATTFHGAGFHLQPLDSGDFLLYLPTREPPTQRPSAQGSPTHGPSADGPSTDGHSTDRRSVQGREPSAVETTEPSRLVVRDVGDCLPSGPGAPYLRQLGAEIEIWLHSHPLNLARAAKGQPPVTHLWLWGGGPATLPGDTGLQASRRSADRERSSARSDALAFASDAYVLGLWRSIEGRVLAIPDQFDALLRDPGVHYAAVVVEVSQVLSGRDGWTELDALAELDRLLIAPAVQALRPSARQGIYSGSSQGVYQGGKQGVSEGTSQDVSQGTNQDVSQGTKQRISEGVNRNVKQAINQGIKQGVNQVTILANDRRVTVGARDHLKLWRRSRAALDGLRCN